VLVWQATGWWLLLLTFFACRLFGSSSGTLTRRSMLESRSSSGTMTRRGLCWKADVTVTVTVAGLNIDRRPFAGVAGVAGVAVCSYLRAGSRWLRARPRCAPGTGPARSSTPALRTAVRGLRRRAPRTARAPACVCVFVCVRARARVYVCLHTHSCSLYRVCVIWTRAGDLVRARDRVVAAAGFRVYGAGAGGIQSRGGPRG
jgi:hypothetical protein